MATVRFSYEMEIDEEVLREDMGLDDDTEITDEDIINRARILFDYEIQDREVYAESFKCTVV